MTVISAVGVDDEKMEEDDEHSDLFMRSRQEHWKTVNDIIRRRWR